LNRFGRYGIGTRRRVGAGMRMERRKKSRGLGLGWGVRYGMGTI
jgi:hypothetical protein